MDPPPPPIWVFFFFLSLFSKKGTTSFFWNLGKCGRHIRRREREGSGCASASFFLAGFVIYGLPTPPFPPDSISFPTTTTTHSPYFASPLSYISISRAAIFFYGKLPCLALPSPIIAISLDKGKKVTLSAAAVKCSIKIGTIA